MPHTHTPRGNTQREALREGGTERHREGHRHDADAMPCTGACGLSVRWCVRCGGHSLSTLNNPAGNKVATPLGNAMINPCSKVTLCDAMQTGSTCCVQVNDTNHPGAARWISCGMTPAQYAPLGGVGTSMGVVLRDGPDCGYIFAPGQKVQASISFKCDRSATGYGRVTADTTAFMKQPASTGGSVMPGGGASKVMFRPELFCNLNFTWSTSLVCGPPDPAPGARCSETPDCPVGEYCDFSHRCYHCSYLGEKCDALDGDCCSTAFLHNCPSNPLGPRCHPCESALVTACNASRSNVFDCARCSGIHQRALQAAGCTNEQIARWCAQPPAKDGIV